jgi:hypothetical protein
MYSTLIIWNTVHTWLFVVVRSKVDGLSSCDHAIFHDIIDTGAHRHLRLHASSALFFLGNCCAYPFRKKKGAIFGMEGVAVNADAG